MERQVALATSPPSIAPIPVAATANEFIEQQLDDRLREIENVFGGAHALSMNCPLFFGVDDILRKSVEKRQADGAPSGKLIVVLTTTGGYLETVQRIVDTIRRFYQLVDFVVPNYAYSAGTVFAMSGDEIYMDYYSRLGPIDPQIESQQGNRN